MSKSTIDTVTDIVNFTTDAIDNVVASGGKTTVSELSDKVSEDMGLDVFLTRSIINHYVKTRDDVTSSNRGVFAKNYVKPAKPVPEKVEKVEKAQIVYDDARIQAFAASKLATGEKFSAGLLYALAAHDAHCPPAYAAKVIGAWLSDNGYGVKKGPGGGIVKLTTETK